MVSVRVFADLSRSVENALFKIRLKADDIVFQLLYSNQPSLVGMLSIFRRFEKSKPICKSHQNFFPAHSCSFFQVVSAACRGIDIEATIEIEPPMMRITFLGQITSNSGDSDQEPNLNSSVRIVNNGFSVKTNKKK